MSKEITIYFNTIFWTSIKWNIIHRYVTRIKSRIYKASISSNQKKLRYLQSQIIFSLSTQLLILNHLLYKHHLSIRLFADLEKIDLIRNLLPQPNIYNKDKVSYHTIYTQHAKYLQYGFVLESEWYAKYDLQEVNYNFCSINRTSTEYIKNNFTLKKDTLSLIQYNFNHYLQENTLQKICQNIDYNYKTKQDASHNLYIYNKLNEFLESGKHHPVYQLLYSIVIYRLILETQYLYKYRNHIINTYSGDKAVYYAWNFQLTICCVHKISLNRWQQYFNLVINNNYSVKLSGKYSSNFTIGLGINNLLIEQSSRYSQNLIVKPNAYSQYMLLNRTKSIIKTSYHIKTYSLLLELNNIIKEWTQYFRGSKRRKTFILLDYLIHLQIKKWVFKHSSQQKKTLKTRFFVPDQYYVMYRQKVYKSRWILYDYINSQMIILLQLHWLI